MLVVKVELWPRGDGTQSKELGRMVIGNVGRVQSGYCYDVTARAEEWIDASGERIHRLVRGAGCVLGYDRRQHVWNLVREALNELRWDE